MLARADRTSTAGLLLASTAWQCEGDVVRAESALRRAAESASGDERPYVIDLLAPLLISRGLFSRAAAVLGGDAASTGALEVGHLAIRSIVDAAAGALALSQDESTAVHERLTHIDDDALRLRMNQRLAMAAYYRGDAATALDEVAHGLQTARLLGAHRAMCTLHSVAYATHYSLIGDFDAAWRHAVALGREAEAAGDRSCRALSRVAVYELAAERGDDEQLAAARAAIDAEPLPEQYRERFAAGIADALRLAWAGDFTTCRNVLTVLKDTAGRTENERAFCRGLLALAAVAVGDDDAVRRFSRQAISTSARPQKHVVAYEMRYRRLARALAAIAGELVGDIVRGRRAADARFLREDAGIAALLDLLAGAPLSAMPASVRGYGRFVLLVRDRLIQRPSVGPLTEMETEILRLIASGRNAPQIAEILNRSPHTIRTHVRNASAKLDAHGRVDMVGRARQLGILTDPPEPGIRGASHELARRGAASRTVTIRWSSPLRWRCSSCLLLSSCSPSSRQWFRRSQGDGARDVARIGRGARPAPGLARSSGRRFGRNAGEEEPLAERARRAGLACRALVIRLRRRARTASHGAAASAALKPEAVTEHGREPDVAVGEPAGDIVVMSAVVQVPNAVEQVAAFRHAVRDA